MACALMTCVQILLDYMDHSDSIQQHWFMEPRQSY